MLLQETTSLLPGLIAFNVGLITLHGEKRILF